MGIILAALAAAGDAAVSSADSVLKQQLAQQNAEHQSALEIQKAEAIDNMRRTRAKADAQQIGAASDDARSTRIADILNSKNAALAERSALPSDQAGPSTAPTTYTSKSPEVADVASSPDKLKAAGIIDRARSVEYDDKIKAAESLGAMDQAKELRGQQQIELARDAEERRASRADTQATNEAERNRIREKKVDSDAEAAAARNETASRRIEALIAKTTGSSGQKAEKVMSLIDSQRKEATSEAGEVNRRLQEEIKANKYGTPEEIAAIKKSYEPEIAAVAKKRKQLDADFSAVREKFGLPALLSDDSDPAPVAKPAAPAAPATPAAPAPKANRPALSTFAK